MGCSMGGSANGWYTEKIPNFPMGESEDKNYLRGMPFSDTCMQDEHVKAYVNVYALASIIRTESVAAFIRMFCSGLNFGVLYTCAYIYIYILSAV